MRLLWHENGWDDYVWWQNQDKKTLYNNISNRKEQPDEIHLSRDAGKPERDLC